MSALNNKDDAKKKKVLGFIPTSPQSAAGMRMLPPWSAPTARSQRPAETSAAHPDEEPPAFRPFAYGLCTGPLAALNDPANMHMFSHTACPTIVAPASSRRVTT